MWGQALLVAAGAHLGLQLVVHLVVYPALADASARAPAGEVPAAHRRHMPRMSLAVAPVYAGLVVAAAGAALSDPSPARLLAAAAVLAVLGVTGLAAVPAHEAVLAAEGPPGRARAQRRLARADLVRLLLGVVVVALAWAGA